MNWYTYSKPFEPAWFGTHGNLMLKIFGDVIYGEKE